MIYVAAPANDSLAAQMSRQNIFVATKICLSLLAYFCHDKRRVLSRQTHDKHVFVATKIILVAAPANNTKRRLRLAERTAHRTKLTVHREIFVKQRNALKALHRAAKGDYLCDKIRHCASIRLLYSVTDELMGRTTEPKLPTNIPLSDLSLIHISEPTRPP